MQYDPQTMQELFRIINSPAGQQLITMLQKTGEMIYKMQSAKLPEEILKKREKRFPHYWRIRKPKSCWSSLGGSNGEHGRQDRIHSE